MRLKRLSIKLKAAVLFTAGILALITLFAIIQSYFTRVDTKQSIGAQQLAMMTQIASEIDERLATTRLALTLAAGATPAHLLDRPDLLERNIESRPGFRSLFDGVAVIDITGKVLVAIPDAAARGLNVGDRDYFKNTMASGQAQISAPFLARSINEPIVVFTAPIFDSQGKAVAILAGSLRLLKPNFLGKLADARVGNTGRFSLIGRDRSVIISRDRERIMTAGPAPGVSPYFDNAVTGREGWEENVNSRGLHALFSYKPLKSMPWVLVAAIPVEEAYAPIALAQKRTTQIMLVLALILPLIAWLVARRVLDPLTRLRDSIYAMRANTESGTLLPVAHKDEIGDLATAFNSLIVQSRASAQARAESEKRLRMITDHMPVLIGYMDTEERYCFVNRTFSEWYGRAESEYLGRTLREVIGEANYAVLSPHIKRGLSGQTVTYQREMTALGRTRQVEGRYIPDIGPDGRVAGVFVLVNDLTERVRATREIEATAAMLRQTVENIPMGISVIDSRLRIVAFNDRFLTLLGFPGEGFAIGDPLAKFFRFNADRGEYGPGDPQEQVESRLALARRAEAHVFERTRGDGTVIEVRGNPVSGGGFVTVFTDVTARREESRRLIEARENAESSGRAKSEFLATMSHEVRTPMNGVLGIAELLLDTPLSAEQRDYVETIHRSGQALLEILNDILDLSKIDANRLDLESIAFDPVQAVRDMVALSAPRASAKGLTLTQRHAGDVPGDVLGDPGRLRQVLGNLIGNSLKFTDAGSVSISVSLEHVVSDDVVLRFAVSDTGIGMSPEQRSRLFQPFTQADASTTRRFGGTGLGLAICRRLVELMGGEFTVDTEPGGGSTFSFTIRCGRAEPGASKARIPDIAPDLRLRGRVLVVEDNLVNRKVARATLSGLGLEVIETVDGSMAVDLVRGQRFDLVLMDMHMPVMDGIEATRRIRAAEAAGELAGHLPIIAMTANVMREAVDACKAAGMDDFLPKPFARRQLIEVLARWLDTRSMPASHRTEAVAAASGGSHPSTTRQEIAGRPVINPVQFALLKETMGGDLHALVADFHSGTDEILAALGASGAECDARLVHRHAHSLGSSAAMVGADHLAMLARGLEANAKKGQLHGLRDALNDLQVEYAAARRALETMEADLGEAVGA